MMERRLTIDEALAVQKLLEADPKLAYVYEHWDQPAAKFPSYVFDSIVILLRGKVLHWMDKYNDGAIDSIEYPSEEINPEDIPF
jgi:hypothetical protein